MAKRAITVRSFIYNTVEIVLYENGVPVLNIYVTKMDQRRVLDALFSSEPSGSTLSVGHDIVVGAFFGGQMNG